jgi:hypothetical protein
MMASVPSRDDEEERLLAAPGRRLLRLVAIGPLVLLLVAVVAVVGVRWWQDRNRSDLERALALAPLETQRFSWTDWAAVRSELHSDVGPRSSAAEVESFLSDGFDADLTSESAMVESATALQQGFGFSPADVDWELLAQSATGSVLLAGLPDSLDVDDLAAGFEQLGYQRPDDEGGVWQGGEELVARLAQSNGASLSPQFQYLALDGDRHLLMASDSNAYLREVVRNLEGDVIDKGLRDVAEAIGDPLAAAVYTGDFACRSLSMTQADESDQSAADQLVAAAGGVDPLAGFAMAAQADGSVRVALAFENDEQARRNADSRSALAAGPAPGQGGDFADRFDLGPVTADGRVVTLELRPVEDSPVLSDLSTGPVLFASC